MEVRLLSVGARGFFLAASRLALAASPLSSVAPNEKKTSGTQGILNFDLFEFSAAILEKGAEGHFVCACSAESILM